MRRLVPLGLALLLCALCAAPAHAAFGFEDLEVAYTDSGGQPALWAGSHPYAMTTTVAFNATGEHLDGGQPRDLFVDLPPGLAGDPYAVPRCSAAEFLPILPGNHSECPDASAVGVVLIRPAGETKFADSAPVYNLVPPPGTVAMIGFHPLGITVTVPLGVRPGGQRNVFAHLEGIPQAEEAAGSRLTVWGVPADPAHDPERGNCLVDHGSCPGPSAERPFLTLPTSCEGPLRTLFAADSWTNPGTRLQSGEPDLSDPAWAQGESVPLPPATPAPIGCSKLGFAPEITAQPTSKAASSPTGLDFSLDVKDEGLTNPSYEAVAGSHLRKAVVTLPEGMTANPSLAEGLEVCTKAQLDSESASSEPGEGCPQAAKVGSVEVETPLLEGKLLKGSLYVAKPYENYAGNALIGLYLVIQNRELGISVKQPLEVQPDPLTGQLITTAEELPQLPFSHFRLHFREGGRSPLISPPTCGAHDVKAVLTPYSGAPPITTTSTFQIISGPGEAPCPPGGVAPFKPGFTAGSINNNAASFSPFYMRLTRRDGEQDMTKFSAILPPGVLGKIAGLAKCPEAGIAKAKARTGAHGGQEELDDPSCPASSKIGRTLAGAGVGSQLTYVPGSLYLAGPVAGDPLSVVSITPALAGPFDAGTVVVREALTLNPVTAEVEVDGSHSDPIPHILKGIPLNVRDLRVYADRPDFILNPTDCTESQARATLFGSFLAPLDPTDDVPAGLSARYQAANCAALGFKPKLAIKLKGGTKRGGHPALKAVVTPRPGDANFAGAVVTLPHSAFLDQAHIRTICTRVEFAANGGNGAGCPAGAIYGRARAWSPLLEEALEGPVYLRSSSHNLPDLVIALHGLVNINLASRIDSHRGGIRSTFEAIPDAPVSKFVLEMQGGKKGLIVNSTNLCASTNRAKAKLTGQNGKLDDFNPPVRASCGKHKKRGARHKQRHGYY